MIYIKNLKVFNCSTNDSFHWSKLPKLICKMRSEAFKFPYSADLRSANLSSADLRFADLRSADLRFANLRFAGLSSADLSSADLRSADLSSADLRSADLSSADLSSADLRFAKLSDIDDKEVIVSEFMSVCGLGSADRNTLIFNTNIGIVIQCGCFYGTEKQFRKQVKETHGNNNYSKEYLEMLKLAKIRFSRGKDNE